LRPAIPLISPSSLLVFAELIRLSRNLVNYHPPPNPLPSREGGIKGFSSISVFPLPSWERGKLVFNSLTKNQEYDTPDYKFKNQDGRGWGRRKFKV